jgi:hypothetical protein
MAQSDQFTARMTSSPTPKMDLIAQLIIQGDVDFVTDCSAVTATDEYGLTNLIILISYFLSALLPASIWE